MVATVTTKGGLRGGIMKALATVLIAAACAALAGCATTRGLEGETGDAVTDANKAFNFGDHRLLVMNTIDYDVPGVSGDRNYLSNVRAKFGVRHTKGTITDSGIYATTYNRTILSLKGCQVEDPMAACQR